MAFISLEQTGNAKSQNRINTSVLFNYVLRNGPTYKSQVAQALSISLPAVSRVFDALEKSGFIEKSGVKISSGGRPVEYYRVSVRDGFVIGIDLLKQKLAMKTLVGDRAAAIEPVRLSGEATVTDLEKEIRSIIDMAKQGGRIKGLEGLKSICIGSPGIVDYETGEIRTAVFHRELSGVNFKAQLERSFAVPVIVDNVVNLSAFAEFQSLRRSEPQNLVCLDIGFEVGAGLVIDGRVFRGRHSTAGEIGFIARSLDDWGDTSTLYARSASFIWLCEQVRDAFGIESRYDDYMCRDENLKAVMRLFTMAEDEDSPKAQEIVDAYLRRLAVVINSMQMMLDPDAVVLSGDICLIPRFRELFLPRLNVFIANVSRFPFPDVVLSEYGTDSALTGACDHAFETYIQRKFPYVMG
jgi:predicted NBD/HSP70 family sugar kinase